MRSPVTATSARRPGAPVPSSTVPPRMTRSAVMSQPFHASPRLSHDESAATGSPGSSRRPIPPQAGPYYALTFVSGKRAGAVPSAMRAAVYRGPHDVAVEDRPVPELGPHDVLLEVSHCGVCGSDLHMFVDGWGAPNSIGGHEFSGRVVAVGDAGTAWS